MHAKNIEISYLPCCKSFIMDRGTVCLTIIFGELVTAFTEYPQLLSKLCETLPIKCAERSGYKLAKHPLPSSVLLAIMLVDDQIGRGTHVTEMCLAWSHLAPRSTSVSPDSSPTSPKAMVTLSKPRAGELPDCPIGQQLQSHLECG